MVGTGSRRFAGDVRGDSARPTPPRLPALRVGGAISSSGPGRYFVFLIVAALLFCHGTFGYAHQLSPVDVQATHTAHSAHAGHAAGVHGSGQGGDVEGLHLGGAYFATLLLLLFGAALLIGCGVSAGATLPALRFRVGREGWRLRPPRGPTLFRLQVFRL